MSQHLTAIPESPRKLNPSVPPGIEAIILKAIRRNPEQRYQSAEAMLQDLQHYEELNLASFAVAPEKAVRGIVLADRQIWVLSAIVAISFVAIVALIVFIVFLLKHH
jgi:serine/threonine-protein kinase